MKKAHFLSILSFFMAFSSYAALQPARITPTTLLGVKGFIDRVDWSGISAKKAKVREDQIRSQLSQPARNEFERLQNNWGKKFSTEVYEMTAFGRPMQVLRANVGTDHRVVVFTKDGKRLVSGIQTMGRPVRWDVK